MRPTLVNTLGGPLGNISAPLSSRRKRPHRSMPEAPLARAPQLIPTDHDTPCGTRTTAMTAKMVAVGYAASLPTAQERALFGFETAGPPAPARDLLVRARAVSA